MREPCAFLDEVAQGQGNNVGTPALSHMSQEGTVTCPMKSCKDKLMDIVLLLHPKDLQHTFPRDRTREAQRDRGNSTTRLALFNHFSSRNTVASCPFLSSAHVQTTATRHPADSSAFRFLRSRSTFASNFETQNLVLLDGVVAYLQPLCRCQKQPCTKTTARYLGRTRSGLPGRSLPCSLNLKPRPCSRLRSTCSGCVSAPRIPAIIRDLVARSTTSTIGKYLLDNTQLLSHTNTP